MAARRVIIIGGGIAGTTVAEGLASKKELFEVTLIERETHPLYSRVLLPHYLRGQIPRERVFLKQEAWYGQKGIEWLRGVEVLEVDDKNKHVVITDGRELPYDILVIAGGGDVRLQAQDLPGICYLRGIDDADTLLATVARSRAESWGEQAVVIGSGFIAVEFINFFHNVAVFPVHVCMRGKGFWSGILGEELQEVLLAHAQAEGVEVHTSAGNIEVEGKDFVQAVTYEGGRIESVGIVGTGIGIVPELDALAQTDIERGAEGVYANEQLRTNVPDVYAIGDIAHYEDIHMKRKATVGNWQNAIMQARHVVKMIEGSEEPFDLVTSYATNLLGLELTFIGDTSREHAQEFRVLHEEMATIELFERDGKTVGAVIAGSPKSRMQITQAIKNNIQYGA
jgi:nitrite reductase (NADH) large subunit